MIVAIVLSVNAIMLLGQMSVTNLNPSADVYYHCNNNILADYEASGCTGSELVLKDSNPIGELPTGNSDVDIGNGNIFTDTFSAAVGWFSGKATYLYNLLAAPANILKALGTPSEFAFGVGALWYGFTLIVIIAFIMGRDY